MKTLVLLNDAAGTLLNATDGQADTLIQERFATHGIACEVKRVPGADLFKTAQEAARAGEVDLIIAGGGDGTLNTIASACVGTSVCFGVLPLGTFNHFAKELQIPLDLGEAVDALATGTTIPFPIGKVNDKHFLLFCAVGLYSDMVRHRDAQREALGRKKMWAGVIAFAKMLVRWPLMRVHALQIEPAHPDIHRLTSTVYISLSGFQMEQMGLSDVPTTTRDALTLLISPHVKRRQLVGFLLKALFRRVSAQRDLERVRCQRMMLSVSRKRVVRVGYDGEVETMQTPLRIERLQNALQMRVPQAYVQSVSGEAKPVPMHASPLAYETPVSSVPIAASQL